MILTALILKDDFIERKEKIFVNLERFRMTSRRPYWCSKPILWELNSFLMQKRSFVPINLNRCWSRECKRSKQGILFKERFHIRGQQLCTFTATKECVYIRKLSPLFLLHLDSNMAYLTLCEKALHKTVVEKIK